ncbi:hypothetical protein ACFQ88_27860 [Paenibacillus sp. NPDC056579]|uniref:hypothetical protein n=1 Tax=Paenibacillus sp. NPDC056579 TaxID=3345871 RepID=UPI003682B191
MMKLSDPLPRMGEQEVSEFKIGHMELFRFDCKWIENRIQTDCRDCTCGLLKLSSGSVSGWAEYMVPASERATGDFARWASVFTMLKGLTIPEALRYIQSRNESWGPIRRALAETALSDLADHLHNPSRLHEQQDRSLERAFLIERSQAYFGY